MSCIQTNQPMLTISLPAPAPRGSPAGVYTTTPLSEYSVGSQASYENSIRGLRSNPGFKDPEMGPSLRRQVVRVGSNATSTVVTPIATPTIRTVSPLPFYSAPSTPVTVTVTVGVSIRRNDPYRAVIASEYSEELQGENAARGIPIIEPFAFTAYSYLESQAESSYYAAMLQDSYYASQAPAGMDPQFLEYSVSNGYMDDQSNSGESVGHVLTSAEVTPKKPKTADSARKPEKKKKSRMTPTTLQRTDADDSDLFPQEPVPELPDFVRSIVSPSQQSASTADSAAPLQRVYYNGRPVPVRASSIAIQ